MDDSPGRGSLLHAGCEFAVVQQHALYRNVRSSLIAVGGLSSSSYMPKTEVRAKRMLPT